MIGATEERTQVARGSVAVGADQPRHLAPRDAHVDGAAARQALDAGPVEIGHEVAEAVHVVHDPGEAVRSFDWRRPLESLVARQRPPERRQRHALGQPGRRGSEAVTSLERAADRGPRVLALAQLDDADRRTLGEDRREQPVVGTDQPVVAHVGGQTAPRRAHARIDHRHEDSADRKTGVARREQTRPGAHVVWRHVVAEVHQRGVGTHAQHHALHGGHVVVAQAKIGEEGDDRASHARSNADSTPARD